jgi:hypothetical protein
MTRRWIGSLFVLGLSLPLLSLILGSSLRASSPKGPISPQISVGQKIPNCTLLDMEVALEYGAAQLYTLLQNEGKTVLIFYRGYW